MEQRFPPHIHLLPSSVLHGPLSFLLSVCAPPSLTTATTTTTAITAATSNPHPVYVWQSHIRPCVCWRCYIMPSFHCTPDQREQSSREKLLLAGFSSFPPSYCFISTRDRIVDYIIIYSSIPLYVEKPNRANGEWSEVSLEKGEKPARLETRKARRDKDAPGVELLHCTFFDVLAFIYLLCYVQTQGM